MREVIIRIAEDSDFEDIYAIWRQGLESSFDITLLDDTVIEKFHSNFLQREGIFNFWVAQDSSKDILGWQSLIRASNNPFRKNIWAESSTYLNKKFRNNGLGEQLLSHVIKEAESSSLQYIIGFVTKSNEAAIQLVNRTGWTEIGEIPQRKNSKNQYPKLIFIRPV